MKNLKEKQINQLCKKHPQWKALFLLYLDVDENLSINELEKTFSFITSHKSIFNNLIDDAKSFLELNDNRSILERLNDKVVLDINSHQKNQFIKSLKTKKYRHLFNNKIEQEIYSILDNKISSQVLKKQFFNKLAQYKNSNELLESLQSFKNKNIQWNREYYEKIIKEKNLNVDILQDQNGYMIIQTNDHKSCKELGSDSWCIVYEQQFFLQYTEDHQRQIIALNFDKPIEDDQSMIGLTISVNGKISCSYLKNDEITPKEIIENFHFPPIPSEKIKSFLEEKTNQEAFYFICQFGLIDFYEEYIRKKNINPSADNNYAIRLASQNGYIDVVNRLLEDTRVDPSDKNNYAIRSASEHGYLDVVNRLLEDTRVDPSDKNNQAIRWASLYGHLDVVNRLLEDTRVDPSGSNNQAIRLASENGHLGIVNILLEDTRVDPSDKNNQAIRLSSLNGHLNVVNRLLEDTKVDPSDKNSDAVLWASKYGYLDVLNRLLEDPRVDPSFDNNYLIGVASSSGHFNVVNRLLEDPRVDPSSINNYALKNSTFPECRELLLKDIRVCKNLKIDWIFKNLSNKEINIYKSTLSKSNNPMNIFKNFYFNLILKIKSN